MDGTVETGGARLARPPSSAPLIVATPSQTAGPFVSIGTEWGATGRVVEDGDQGAISVTGSVFDGSGTPVTDAMLEFWQADPDGRFPPETPPTWTGFTRALTDGEGRYRLVTLKPGPVPGRDGGSEAPHVDVSIFARGLLQRLVTRIYFSDEGSRNDADPVLASLGSPSLMSALVASREPGGHSYHFDIYLQGDQETVFFAPW
ncbi:MAG TPA: protocatechuate 3,4-dioxygenase subunit alpha [Acidimicrobiales bacterium]|nr:protocatechuate 3,4-dioxygenase subunit alpha [Acidimicrobiales bacterium]